MLKLNEVIFVVSTFALLEKFWHFERREIFFKIFALGKEITKM